MSLLFGDFYDSECEDEIKERMKKPKSERNYLSLSQGFDIAQIRPVLEKIADNSSEYPWLFDYRSWVIYEKIGPWRLLLSWKLGVKDNIWHYKLALGSTIDKDLALGSVIEYCGQHHKREKTKFFTINSHLLSADSGSRVNSGMIKNVGSIAALDLTNDSSILSHIPLFLYEV